MPTINNQYPALTSSRKGIFFQTEYFAGNQIASQNNVGYNIVPRNYFTYRHMSDDEIFHFNINDICDFGIVSTLYPVFTTKKELDSKYLQYQLNYGKEFAKFASLQKQGGSRTYMYFAKLKELVLTMPKVEEQTKISSILSNIDNLITLHQRKFNYILSHKLEIKLFFFMITKNVWEQRKLGEIGNTFTGLSGKTKEDFGHGEAKFVTYMNVFSNPIAQLNKTEPIEIDNKQNQVEYGDVFFTTSSETPDEVGMSSVWLENKGNIYLNSFCFGFRPFVKNDPYYMAYMLRSKNFRKNMILLAQGISRYNISKNGVMNIYIQLPNNQEQEKIGKLFYEIDNLITLHQRKCTYIFYSWEQRKLNEFTRYISSNLSISDSINNGKYNLYDANNIIGKVNCKNISEEFITIIKDGSGVGKVRRLPKNSCFIGTMGGILSKESNIDFVYCCLLNTDFTKEINGATIPHIYYSNYGNNEYYVPKYLEQEKIGELFTNIDNLITLHQHKELKRRNDNNDNLRW